MVTHRVEPDALTPALSRRDREKRLEKYCDRLGRHCRLRGAGGLEEGLSAAGESGGCGGGVSGDVPGGTFVCKARSGGELGSAAASAGDGQGGRSAEAKTAKTFANGAGGF